MFSNKSKMPTPADALKGRVEKMPVPPQHHVLRGATIEGPYPDGTQKAMFGLGCFWGAEKKFWQLPGVYTTGHNEVVLVVFDPKKISYDALLKAFWESHNPTQGMRQGNDVGTQYRSGIYYYDEAQRAAAERSRDDYQRALAKAGHGAITTEIIPAPEFYFAEDYHQQYLSKNPDGYCGLGGTGVSCPVGVSVA